MKRKRLWKRRDFFFCLSLMWGIHVVLHERYGPQTKKLTTYLLRKGGIPVSLIIQWFRWYVPRTAHEVERLMRVTNNRLCPWGLVEVKYGRSLRGLFVPGVLPVPTKVFEFVSEKIEAAYRMIPEAQVFIEKPLRLPPVVDAVVPDVNWLYGPINAWFAVGRNSTVTDEILAEISYVIECFNVVYRRILFSDSEDISDLL